MRLTYLDSSAFVKLVVAEPQSDALRHWLRGRPAVSSMLLIAEVLRTARRHGRHTLELASRMVGRLELLRISPYLLRHSAALGGADIRTLDAIHLASALALGDQLGAMVTYDERLGEAARSLGLRVTAPAEGAQSSARA